MITFIYKAGDPDIHKKLGQELNKLPKGGDYIITWKRNRPVRSTKANAYYRVVLKMIAEETGHTVEQLHDYCKAKFINNDAMPDDIPIHEQVAWRMLHGRSTKELDTKEFASLIIRVKEWARDMFGMNIPEAKDLDYQKMIEIENNYERTIAGQ